MCHSPASLKGLLLPEAFLGLLWKAGPSSCDLALPAITLAQEPQQWASPHVASFNLCISQGRKRRLCQISLPEVT